MYFYGKIELLLDTSYYTICISLGYCNLAQILILCDNRLLKVHTENTANKQIGTKGFSSGEDNVFFDNTAKVRSQLKH